MKDIFNKKRPYRPPGFAERWALLVFLFFLLVLFAIAWFVKDPDLIRLLMP